MDHEHQIVAKNLRLSPVHLPNSQYYLQEIASTSIDPTFQNVSNEHWCKRIQCFGSDSNSILQSLNDGWHAQISQTNLRNVLHINNLKQNECTKKVQPIQRIEPSNASSLHTRLFCLELCLIHCPKVPKHEYAKSATTSETSGHILWKTFLH